MEKLNHAFITVCLGHCDGLYLGISQTSLTRLQPLQTSVAWLLTVTRSCQHITPILSITGSLWTTESTESFHLFSNV